jgi:hypothetical protein
MIDKDITSDTRIHRTKSSISRPSTSRKNNEMKKIIIPHCRYSSKIHSNMAETCKIDTPNTQIQFNFLAWYKHFNKKMAGLS